MPYLGVLIIRFLLFGYSIRVPYCRFIDDARAAHEKMKPGSGSRRPRRLVSDHASLRVPSIRAPFSGFPFKGFPFKGSFYGFLLRVPSGLFLKVPFEGSIRVPFKDICFKGSVRSLQGIQGGSGVQGCRVSGLGIKKLGFRGSRV